VVHDCIEEIIVSLSSDALPVATLNQLPSSAAPRSRGRPKLSICKEQVKFLANFTKHDIAILLRYSSKTISRQLQEFNITLQTTQVADDNLDKATLLYVQRYPNAGQKNYGAFLLGGQDIYISRQRVRDSLLELTLMVFCKDLKKQ